MIFFLTFTCNNLDLVLDYLWVVEVSCLGVVVLVDNSWPFLGWTEQGRCENEEVGASLVRPCLRNWGRWETLSGWVFGDGFGGVLVGSSMSISR